MNDGTEIGLAEAIQAVRAELRKAASCAADDDLKFRVGNVEVQFGVQIVREGNAQAGVKLWVLDAGMNGRLESSRTHSVTVTLTPGALMPDGHLADLRISDQVDGLPPAPSSGTSRYR